jgi:uncharacterized protein YdbL (DUF1318 family)
MKRKVLIGIISLALSSGFIFSAMAFGQDIKARIKARRPIILELKAAGIIGENSMGYLEFRGSKKKNEDVVNAENSDRKIVYKKIGEKTGTTTEVVGQRRALKIAELAKPGDWLQNASGKWYRKK